MSTVPPGPGYGAVVFMVRYVQPWYGMVCSARVRCGTAVVIMVWYVQPGHNSLTSDHSQASTVTYEYL